jgi:hypothetical protein
MKNKALVWVLVIGGVGLVGLISYKIITRPAATANKPLFTAADLSAAGSFFTNLFKKKDNSADPAYAYNNINTVGNVDPAIDLGYTVNEATEG